MRCCGVSLSLTGADLVSQRVDARHQIVGCRRHRGSHLVELVELAGFHRRDLRLNGRDLLLQLLQILAQRFERCLRCRLPTLQPAQLTAQSHDVILPRAVAGRSTYPSPPMLAAAPWFADRLTPTVTAALRRPRSNAGHRQLDPRRAPPI